MKIDIFTKMPDRLYEKIINSISEESSHHMELWEVVNEKGIDLITQRDVKYYFKVLLEPKIYEGEKLRFSYVFHEYSEPKHSVQCEYMGRFAECILFNFSHLIKGIQIFPS